VVEAGKYQLVRPRQRAIHVENDTGNKIVHRFHFQPLLMI
jgi:hypothetical protein